MKVCVIIPTYNEARQVGRLVREVRQQGLDVLVVDDGSTDGTPKIARDNGALVLTNAVNQGKGRCLIRGFDHCLARGYDAVLVMDGDGQHLPEDIRHFMRLAEQSDSAVIVGNRMKSTANMPLLRIFTNRLMSWLISGMVKQKIPDSQCGFRLIKREALERIGLVTSRYEIESEILIKAARSGFKIGSVPIKTVYSDEKSRINPFVDSLRFFAFILKENGLRGSKKADGRRAA